MSTDLLLGAHVAASAAGLAVGPPALRAALAGDGARRAGDAYHWLVAATCLTAVALVTFDPSRLWFFVPIAAASYGLALAGRVASHRRGRRARRVHLRGYGGAYIALVSAVAVVGAGGQPLLWLLPTAVGVPALHLALRRLDRDGPAVAGARARASPRLSPRAERTSAPKVTWPRDEPRS